MCGTFRLGCRRQRRSLIIDLYDLFVPVRLVKYQGRFPLMYFVRLLFYKTFAPLLVNYTVPFGYRNLNYDLQESF